MKRLLRLLWIPLILWLSSPSAWAHKPGDSFLAVDCEPAVTRVECRLSLRDLEYAVGVDANGDGEITWGELRQAAPQLQAFALSHLEVAVDGRSLALEPAGLLVDDLSDGTYAVLRFRGGPVRPARALTIDYRALFDFDAQHRGWLRVMSGGTTRTGVFAPGSTRLAFTLAGESRLAQFGVMMREGVWHIWTGYDHLLFLLALLLPSVVRGGGKGASMGMATAAELRLAEAVGNVFKVVTAFTVAHSLTLGLAAFGVVRLPAQWTEAAIAASVIAAALNNIVTFLPGRAWAMAFAFGLIHGFGFANVLADLDPGRSGLLVGLGGFNLGVELGQGALVALFLPVAFLVRDTRFYQRAAVPVGSCAIALAGTAWLVERLTGFGLRPG